MLPQQRAFLAWLFSRAGLPLECYRPAPLVRRLASCLRRLRVDSLAEARERIEACPALVAEALGMILIGVTSFGRDTAVFERLRSSVLPGLGGPRLRVWSVGCADGSELYSIGALLAHDGRLGSSRLLGTDCRQEAITAARRGRFEEARVSELGALGPALFEPCGKAWQVRPRWRGVFDWRQEDALQSAAPHEPFDLVSCRNVAIYLQCEAAERLWAKLSRALRPGGVLVVGKAERPLRAELRSIGPCIFQRQR